MNVYFANCDVAAAAELKADAARGAEELAGLGKVDPPRGKVALGVFDWSQRAAGIPRFSLSKQERVACRIVMREVSGEELPRDMIEPQRDGPKLADAMDSSAVVR